MTTLAFKYVAIALMMAEANFYADKMQLKMKLPITDQDVIARRASDFGKIGFIGGIDTQKHHFGFADSGKSRVITRWEDRRWQFYGIYRGDIRMKDFMKKLVQVKSTINTNDAYRLATNWLTGLGLDIDKLNNGEPLIVKQDFLMSNNGEKQPVPLFHVNSKDRGNDESGHPIGPVITIMISGINGELLSFHESDNPYSKRPMVLIKDMDKLLAISDEEFLKYSDMERSNLVVRFSAVTYSASTNAIFTASTATNAVTTTNAPVP
jgi:hypothetical protein